MEPAAVTTTVQTELLTLTLQVVQGLSSRLLVLVAPLVRATLASDTALGSHSVHTPCGDEQHEEDDEEQ